MPEFPGCNNNVPASGDEADPPSPPRSPRRERRRHHAGSPSTRGLPPIPLEDIVVVANRAPVVALTDDFTELH